jgi:putative addiction module killer protein
MAEGNFSNVKGVGGGVFERRIDFGAGYRIYFGKVDESTLLILAGGTKQRQQRSIDLARERWLEYRRRR